MSKYTTGEVAKICFITVRTVQYYDKRGILIPSELSEGGRRLYSEEDLKKMQIICFLRNAGVSLNSIKKILSEKDCESVISVLISQHEKELREKSDECQKKLESLGEIKRFLKDFEEVTVESIGDIANVMKNKEKIKKVRMILLLTAIPLGIIEWVSIFIWILKGIWWPFAVYIMLAVPYLIWMFNYYYNNISYICSKCHSVFKPDKKEFFFSKHTLTTRKLTCTVCNHKGFCVETCAKEDK